jgi:hypothetical protein
MAGREGGHVVRWNIKGIPDTAWISKLLAIGEAVVIGVLLTKFLCPFVPSLL